MTRHRETLSHVVTIVLAGGAGTRLFPLTKDRSKPAVPLGGKYRLIDVAISNSLNSGLRNIFVLTQFNSASLNHHVATTFNFDPFSGGSVEVLAAEQTVSNIKWFQGTADAVRQHLRHFTARDEDYQLVLAGDQLYRMNYQGLIEAHWKTGADVTICLLPRSESDASSLGLLKLDRDGRVVDFREKPKGEQLREMKTDITPFGYSPGDARRRPYLGSMGIYLFGKDVLIDMLSDESLNDFGYQLIPRAIEKYHVYGYLFDGYWEDLGTIGTFFKANIDLTRSIPHFDFFDMNSPIYTRPRFLPPSRIENCDIRESIIAEGSILHGTRISNSVVGIRSVIRNNVALEESLVMGADYYEDDDDLADNRQAGRPPVGIGRNTTIRRSIIDKNARIGEDVRILNEAGVAERDADGYYIRDGIVIVPRKGIVPSGTVI